MLIPVAVSDCLAFSQAAYLETWKNFTTSKVLKNLFDVSHDIIISIWEGGIDGPNLFLIELRYLNVQLIVCSVEHSVSID